MLIVKVTEKERDVLESILEYFEEATIDNNGLKPRTHTKATTKELEELHQKFRKK
jgi:predicted RNA binding protein with dsRBD fold (UPF0201 family)